MTAPDHRPYLLATDLRTAEDVARWLRENAPRYYDDGVADALDARLDRERRQACRRGALDRWRRVRELVRWAGAYRDATWAWHEIAPSLWFALRDALAFRAAARQP